VQDKIETVEKAKAFINENIQEVMPDSVAFYCNYSARQLSRIFELVTGATLGEFLRWTRLSKALYELKYTESAILDIALKFKYESQEAFTRIFKDTYGVAPGEYRKSKVGLNITGNSHPKDIIEEISHEAANKGLYIIQDVNVRHVVKPARIWISIETNKNNKPPFEFWRHCDMACKSVFDDVIPADLLIGYGAAYLTMIETKDVMKRMSWGLEVDGSYDIEGLKSCDCGKFRIVERSCDIDSLGKNGYDIFLIPESKYVVFNVPKHTIEKHGGAIRSVWELVDEKYNYSDYGLAWNHKVAPMYEDDNDELGYSVWVPVKDKRSANK